MVDTNQSKQQVPSMFTFGNVSNDAFNLSNYVDQIYNEEPVDKIPIPLSTVSTEDQKFDNKLNTNCDNVTGIGAENLRSYAYPGDTAISIDLEKVCMEGNLYTTEIAGWIVLEKQNPVESDYVQLKNINNNMISIDTYNVDKTILQAKLPVSKYQVVNITYSGIDSVITRTLSDEAQQKVSDTQAAYDAAMIELQNAAENPEEAAAIEIPTVYVPVDSDYNIEFNGLPEGLSCTYIASGTQSNIGETLIQTRDYRDIMSGIGFPDITKIESLSLPDSGNSIYVETDCYISIAVKLQEQDYFSMYTNYTGVDLVYSEYSPKLRRAVLSVGSNTIVTFEYSLTNSIEYLVQINTKGRAI